MFDADVYGRLVESITDQAIILLDVDGTIVAWNHGAEAIKGYTAEEAIGQHFSMLYTPEAVSVRHPQAELASARAAGRYHEAGWRVRKDGARFWASVTIIAMRHEDGTLQGYGKVTLDLTELMQAEQQSLNTLQLLRTTAETDALTGALTRRALDATLLRSMELGQPFCVAMLDLDKFKQLNDRHGHAAGDQVLREISADWRRGLRPGDALARYGGEEFALLIQDCDLKQGTVTVDRIRASSSASCTCSAGVAEWTPGMTADDLLAAADAALYEAKRGGRNRVSAGPKRVSSSRSRPLHPASQLLRLAADPTD
jgi:diguanylate cyclase (GGDEF)-like protein/PAS domain S-box-containing protein